MKNWRILLFTATLLCVVGCETELDVLGVYEDNPAVFGILDQNQDTQFVRVNKAFLGNADINEMANNPDSISYANGVIKVEILNSANNNVIQLLPISKPKQDGFFDASKNVVFYTTDPISFADNNANEITYELVTTNTQVGTVIKGQTNLVKDISITRPFIAAREISFVAPANLKYVKSFEIEWQSSTNAVKHEIYFRFIYDEINTVTKDTIQQFYDYKVGDRQNVGGNRGNTMKASLLPEIFYNALGQNIPIPAAEVVRIRPRIQIRMIAANEDLSLYIDLNGPATGINQNQLAFSNMSNGIGLFAARNERTVFPRILTFTNASENKLINSDETKHLKFKFE